MSKIPVLDYDAVLAAVPVVEAIAATRRGFVAHHAGEWSMPPKVYLVSAPYGDFRAMPALGGGFALLKWVTSFPGNRDRGLPVVSGVVCLSDAETGLPLMLLDGRAVTALRTGAVAAVASRALASSAARTVGIIGCGVHGRWTGRSMLAEGYSISVCADADRETAQALATELRCSVGSTDEALACDIVCCVTPGGTQIVTEANLRPGQHYNMLGADGPGKAEATTGAVASCSLFCDEWSQAAHGGELTAAVDVGLVIRAQVRDLGEVLAGAPGRRDTRDITMFDSTGLATQDLAVAIAAYEAWSRGDIAAQTIEL